MIVTVTPLTPTARRPLLVVGPSLGTAVERLWGPCAAALADRFDVVGWDLPGHGRTPPPPSAYTVADLASAMMTAIDETLDARGETGAAVRYAGVSLGGAVGLQLLLDHPERITDATLLATGAVIATPDTWRERAALVRADGTDAVVAGSRERWFAPAFRDTDAARALLDDLTGVDDESYALACGALERHDVRAELREIATPVLTVAGAEDPICPPESLRAVAEGVRHGRTLVLAGTAHLPPVERPREVADAIAPSDGWHTGGLAVRRAVLGAEHVDAALESATGLTREFQQFITEYAWGGVWTRPGLDRRTRSLLTITALVAGGHDHELALHLRAARTNGVTVDKIKECLLQAAIYCGVPAANNAFRIASQVYAAGNPLPSPYDR